jgi:hypothetical protein
MQPEMMSGTEQNMTPSVDNRLIYPLKPCPWCKYLPRFVMYYEDKTWLPHLWCNNSICNVQPKSKKVPIRKAQKKNKDTLRIKIEKAFFYWNHNNPIEATEGMIFDYDAILQEKMIW